MELERIAGPLRIQLLEPTEEMSEGGRTIVVNPTPYRLVEIPIPKEMVERIGRDLLLNDEQFVKQAEEEAERQAAADRLIVPNNGAAPA